MCFFVVVVFFFFSFFFCGVICVKVAYFRKIQVLKNVFIFETGSHCVSLAGFKSPGTGVLDSCELLFECWEYNQGPLEEQPVLSTRVISNLDHRS